MCGIAGIVSGDADRPVRLDRLRAMSDTLRHRGPDEEGMHLRADVGLAIRRLAVIDPRDGHQPVHSEDQNVQVVFNGEIYNHRRLRAELARRGHRLVSGCDSEVIPHLYEEYGLDFVTRLEGMFAVALWDRSRRRLVLARDRLGIKPLYYAVQDGAVVFGSEMKALLAAELKTTIDAQAVSDYLSLMYIPGSRSIYSEIRKVPPASTLVWQDGGYAIRRYWDLADRPQRTDLSAGEARDTLRHLLAESVSQQMAADVPVGFFLSGGIDSGTVVATARRVRPDATLKTFSVGFTDRSYDERDAAATVARRFGCDHTELVVRPRPDDVVDRMVPSYDEPFADPSMVPTYYLSELARQQVTVALSGDGGDELFAGYLTYQADKIARYYRRLPRILTGHLMPSMLRLLPASDRRMALEFKARRFVDNALEHPGRSHYLWRVILREERKAQLIHPELFEGVADTYASHQPHHHEGRAFDPLTRFQYTDTKVYLADDVLTKVDRASMAHSLEVRVPLLATPVVEFAFSLPGRLKMPGYQTKPLLRRAMAGELPREVVDMSKKGFNAPVGRWLREDFRPLVEEYLSRGVLQRQGYLRFDGVDALVRRHMSGTFEHGRELWALLVFSIWAERHKAYR
jgi:asparagine synthase (glutamine-hydrolysing)